MLILLLAVHILVAISLVGVVLLQKSEGGALGMGGGGMSGFMTGRSTSNLLTRATAILAAAFMTTSVLLVVLQQPRARAALDSRARRACGAGSFRQRRSRPAPPAEPAQPERTPSPLSGVQSSAVVLTM